MMRNVMWSHLLRTAALTSADARSGIARTRS
jgi:hypothetical protein